MLEPKVTPHGKMLVYKRQPISIPPAPVDSFIVVIVRYRSVIFQATVAQPLIELWREDDSGLSSLELVHRKLNFGLDARLVNSIMFHGC